MQHRKGCLKLPSPMPSPSLLRKCVVFGANEDVHIADEWDRTPTEPAPKLSYQEMLEFNAIQRSLPHANQLPDPYTGKPARQYLSTVPVGLLPLLNEESKSPPPSPSSSPFSADKHALGPPTSPPVKMKPKFAFLPLLDTPPKKEEQPSALRIEAVPSPALPPPSPFSLSTPKTSRGSYFDREVLTSAPGLTRKKPRSIIVINDMEFEVDDEEEEEVESSAESSKQEEPESSAKSSKQEEEAKHPSQKLVLGTSAISIPPKPTPSSSSSSSAQLSSSVSSTTSTYSHSTTTHTDYDFDHEEDDSEGGVQTLHSPLASPVSSVEELEDKWGSPSTSPIALSSPLGVKPRSSGCSPKLRRRGGAPGGGSPCLVPSA